MSKKSDIQPPHDIGGGLAVGVLVGLSASVAIAFAAFAALPTWPPVLGLKIALVEITQSPALALAMRVAEPQALHDLLVRTDHLTQLQLVLLASLAAGLLLGALGGYYAARPIPAVRHIAGRQRIDQQKKAAKHLTHAEREDINRSGEGIELGPGARISIDRETRHTLVLGSVGAGKTVILRWMLNQIIERGDRVLIFDVKGDFTQTITSPNLELLAPWDKRSAAWSVAKDCRTKSDARDLAARLITEGKDPMWTSGARMILVALIRNAQRSKPDAWTWKDVIDELSHGPARLHELMQLHTPETAGIIEDLKSKTTSSFITTLLSYMPLIADLADAWGDPKQRQFSAREWVDGVGRGVVIMQGSGRYSELTKAYTQGLIGALSSYVTSPECEDSTERRLWLILDEAPQLGKIPNISKLLELVRSKGLRVVLGLQDISQIRELYGRDSADAWSSMCGTTVIARTQGKETPEWLSGLTGDRKVRRWQPSYSGDMTISGSQNANSRTDNFQLTDEPVIRPEEFASEIGAGAAGVTAFVLTGGEYVYRLGWPYPSRKKYRPAVKPAAWTSPDWPHHSAQRIAEAAAAALQNTERADDEDDEPTNNQQTAAATVVTKPRLPVPQVEDEPDLTPAFFAELNPTPDPEQQEPSDGELKEKLAEETAQHAIAEALPGVADGIEIAGLIVDAVAEISATASDSDAVQVQQPRKRRRRRKAEPEQENEL